jgi:hypothetical protein
MDAERTLALIKEIKQNFTENLLAIVSKEDSYRILQAYLDAESKSLLAYLARTNTKIPEIRR